MTPHDWNAADYDETNAGIIALGVEVLDRLQLKGDETILDAGCGTGAVMQRLLDRLPQGGAIGIDASPQMVEAARVRFGDRAEVLLGDLSDFDLGGRTVDGVLSTATFHWIEDHERLFRNLRAVTNDGGQLVAQCGGLGNIEPHASIAREVGSREPYAGRLESADLYYFYGPDETEQRMLRAGWSKAKCWLEERPIYPVDPPKHMREVVIGAHIAALGPELGEQFASEVEAQLGEWDVVDYVRLNIDAIA